MIGHLLHVEMIEHGERIRENEALVQELVISVIVVINVGLLREELSGRLCRHKKLVHKLMHLGIGLAVSCARVLAQLFTGVNDEVPAVRDA